MPRCIDDKSDKPTDSIFLLLDAIVNISKSEDGSSIMDVTCTRFPAEQVTPNLGVF